MDNLVVFKYVATGTLAVVVVYAVVKILEKRESFSVFDMALAPNVTGEQEAEWKEQVDKYNKYKRVDQYKVTPELMSEKERELMEKTDQLSPENLLPAESGNLSLAGKNFLANQFEAGIDTRGSSMRNANLQLRSDPVVPKIENLTPFNNSTVEQDPYRKKLEIGGGC